MDFLPDSDFFYIIVIGKGSFGFGTFSLGWKWHQRTVWRDTIFKKMFQHSVYTSYSALSIHLNDNIVIRYVTLLFFGSLDTIYSVYKYLYSSSFSRLCLEAAWQACYCCFGCRLEGRYVTFSYYSLLIFFKADKDLADIFASELLVRRVFLQRVPDVRALK